MSRPAERTPSAGKGGEAPLGVAMTCIYYPPEVGGLESHVHHLARGLVRLGHRVTMVTSRSVTGSPREERVEGVDVRRTWMPFRGPVGWTLHALASTPSLWRTAREADLVHAHTFASGLPAAIASMATGRSLVLTLHTSHFLRLAERSAWRPYLAWLVRRADRVLGTSEEIRDVARSLAPGAEVEAITNGVDVTLFHPGAGERSGARDALVVPRRLFAKNGVEHFVRALPLVLEERSVRALLVGDGPERGRLEALARELGVAESIRFAGARPHSEMPGLLASADVAVIPSLAEATSVAALEALACGTPVAASRVGGLPQIVDESVGTLFEPGDPEDLARRLVALLERDDLEQAGQLGRERVVERWSNERLARDHERWYRNLVERRGGNGG